jgi:MscS family membrane protein
MVDRDDTIRVRFFRFAPFSLDIEVFAYVYAADWNVFLEIQQDLLLDIMGIVERHGAVMALPSQTLHLADGRASAPDAGRPGVAVSAQPGARHQSAGSS